MINFLTPYKNLHISKYFYAFIIVFNFVGCKESATVTEYPIFPKACPMIGFIPMLEITLTTSVALPQNIVVSLNTSNNLIQECATPNNFESRITVDANRTAAKITVFTNYDSTFFNSYFDSVGNPTSDLIDIHLYSQANCNSASIQIQSFVNTKVNWIPYSGNDLDCKINLYNGEVGISN